MPDQIRLTSTTDSQAEVEAALGVKAGTGTPPPVVDENAASDAKSASADKGTPPAATPDEKAASDAGKKLSEKKTRLQSRIDDLTREKYDTQRERDLALQKVTQLNEELSRLKAAPAAETTKAEEKPKPGTVASDVPKPLKPKEDDFPVFADYEAAKDKYEEDLVDWKADQKVAALRAELKAEQEADRKRAAEEQVTAAAHTAQQKFVERQKIARSKHADFDEALDKGKDLPAPVWVRNHLAKSEIGAELHYYLATHPTETIEMSQKEPEDAVKHLLRLELKHEAGTLFADETDDDEPAVEKAPRVPVSHAPPPGARVGSGSTVPMIDPARIKNYQEYKQWRATTERDRMKQRENRRGLL